MVDAKPNPQPAPPFGFQMISASGTRSLDFKDIYTNASRVGVTPWDFSITVSLTKDIAPGMPPIIEDQAVLRMSPQHFKIFSKSISDFIAAWEEVFGQVIVDDPVTSPKQMKEGMQRLKDSMTKRG
jgi:hypothetical protein